MALLVKEVAGYVAPYGIEEGWPCVRVVLGNCNLACAFCDVEYDAGLVSMDEEALATEILACPVFWQPRKSLVWVTGGEPAVWGDFDVVMEHVFSKTAKEATTIFYHLETNGTQWWPWMKKVDLAVSPKAGLREIPHDVRMWTRYLVFLVGDEVEPYYDTEQFFLGRFPALQQMYLLPVRGPAYEKNLAAARVYAAAFPKFKVIGDRNVDADHSGQA